MTTRLVSVVIDSADPARLADWWGAALGWPVEHHPDESGVAPPPGAPGAPGAPGIDLTFVPVTEPKALKNRIHLDLFSADADAHLAQVARLLESGAQRIDIGQNARPGGVPWVVLADPEGNEFCVADPWPAYGDPGPIAAISMDCTDPALMATFWAQATGWTVQAENATAMCLRAPDGTGPWFALGRSDTPHTVKNRVHLDVAGFPDDDQAQEVERLRQAGAVPAEVGQSEAEPGAVTWVVLADPEQNEFCVLSSR